MNLLCHTKFIASATCVISMIIMGLLCRSCTPKQIDLQVFLLLQLSYCVSVLLTVNKGM